MTNPARRRTFSEQIEASARSLADRFKANYEDVLDCEWAMFTYHAATGDDRDCQCGAHAKAAAEWLAANPARQTHYKPEDFG